MESDAWTAGNLIDRIGATLADSALGMVRGFAHDVRHGRRSLTADERLKATVTTEVFDEIAESDGDIAARRWLFTGNLLLGGGMPLAAIREGRYEEVRDAARTFLGGSGG